MPLWFALRKCMQEAFRENLLHLVRVTTCFLFSWYWVPNRSRTWNRGHHFHLLPALLEALLWYLGIPAFASTIASRAASALFLWTQTNRLNMHKVGFLRNGRSPVIWRAGQSYCSCWLASLFSLKCNLLVRILSFNKFELSFFFYRLLALRLCPWLT